MSKVQFLEMFVRMYRVANRADHESRESWTHPLMAGPACCQLLDKMSSEMLACGVLTQDEHDMLYMAL